MFARLGTRGYVEKKGQPVSGTLKHIDPFMHWIEVEERTEDDSKVHFINVHAISEIIGVGTDHVVKRRNGG